MKQTHKGHWFKRNRAAAHWRAHVIHAMRAAGHSYNVIAGYFDLSAERARQICARPPPAAQLNMVLPSGETRAD